MQGIKLLVTSKEDNFFSKPTEIFIAYSGLVPEEMDDKVYFYVDKSELNLNKIKVGKKIKLDIKFDVLEIIEKYYSPFKVRKHGDYFYFLVNDVKMASFSNRTQRMWGATKYFKNLEEAM